MAHPTRHGGTSSVIAPLNYVRTQSCNWSITREDTITSFLCSSDGEICSGGRGSDVVAVSHERETQNSYERVEQKAHDGLPWPSAALRSFLYSEGSDNDAESNEHRYCNGIDDGCQGMRTIANMGGVESANLLEGKFLPTHLGSRKPPSPVGSGEISTRGVAKFEKHR